MSWLLRFEGKEELVPELGQELNSSFDQLKVTRTSWDNKILNWTNAVTEKWLSEDFAYTSKVDGSTHVRKAWLLVTHMFNHETHHRGQLTAALSNMGYDFGVTDLPFLVDK